MDQPGDVSVISRSQAVMDLCVALEIESIQPIQDSRAVEICTDRRWGRSVSFLQFQHVLICSGEMNFRYRSSWIFKKLKSVIVAKRLTVDRDGSTGIQNTQVSKFDR